jgi:hypothetical protein
MLWRRGALPMDKPSKRADGWEDFEATAEAMGLGDDEAQVLKAAAGEALSAWRAAARAFLDRSVCLLEEIEEGVPMEPDWREQRRRLFAEIDAFLHPGDPPLKAP